MEDNKVNDGLLTEVDKKEDLVVNETIESNAMTSEEIREELRESADEIDAKAQELMRLISDPRVMGAYRDARNSNGRRQVSKEERKKKKAKRRMAKKSRR